MRLRLAPAPLPRRLEVDRLFSETHLRLMAIIDRGLGVKLRMALPLPTLLPWPMLPVETLKHPLLLDPHPPAAHQEMVAQTAMQTPQDPPAPVLDQALAETART
jgi:hypothetical protein